MESPVSVARCANYSAAEVKRALRDVLSPLGGLEWVKPGMKIAVKVNLITFIKPEKAATTHPSLVAELCRILVEKGAEVIVGDSPGGPYTSVYLNSVYSATGMDQVEEVGAFLNHNFKQSDAHFPEAAISKEFKFTSWLGGVDAIINFSKLKTHGMMGMSAAVKNLFGAILGTIKPEYHFRFPNTADFANMLVDLNEYFKPRLCLVDAVTAMEGNGPTMGTPRHIGALLASGSPYALDLACARIMGLERKSVPTLQAAYERNLAYGSVDEVNIIGDLKSVCVTDYKNLVQLNSVEFFTQMKGPFGKVLANIFAAAMRSKPGVEADICIGCGKCFDVCPAKAIKMNKKLPVIERNKCIRCYCCQELCPKGAMKLQRPFIARALGKL